MKSYSNLGSTIASTDGSTVCIAKSPRLYAWSEDSSLCLLFLGNDLRIKTVSGAAVSLMGKAPEGLLNHALHEMLNPAPCWEGKSGDFCVFAFGTGKNLRGFWSRIASGIQLVLVELEKVSTRDSELKGFASSITHEIRNPLASIKMVVQTLAQAHNTDERTSRRLAIADREIRTVERVLLALSEFSRSASLIRESLDPAGLLEQAIQEVLIESKGDFCPMHTVVEPGLPLIVVDSTRIGLALVYLILQALRWSENQPLVINLKKAGQGVVFELQIPSLSTEDAHRPLCEGRISISLSMASKIAREHGGDLSTHSLEEHFLYRLFLPVRG